MGALSAVLGWPLSMDIKTKDYARVVTTGRESRPSDFLLAFGLENKRRYGLLMIPSFWSFLDQFNPESA